jgi:hypothetical protein
MLPSLFPSGFRVLKSRLEAASSRRAAQQPPAAAVSLREREDNALEEKKALASTPLNFGRKGTATQKWTNWGHCGSEGRIVPTIQDRR